MSDDDLGFVPTQNAQEIKQDDLGFVPSEPDTSAMKSHVESNMKDEVAKIKEKEANSEVKGERPIEVPPPHPANGLIEALDAGWQGSFSGLWSRNKMPDTVLPEDAPLAMNIASQISAFAGDLPAIAAGMVGGAAAGSEVPIVGNIVGGAAGAFAVPAAMRKVLIDHYQKGDIQSASDFAGRAVGASWEALKGGVTGAAAALGGGAASTVAGPIAGKVAEIAAMTTVAKGLEGHLPNWKDFAAGAVVIGGMHAVGAGIESIQDKMADIYKQSGAKPADIVDASMKDPSIKQDIISSNIEGKRIEVPTQEEQLEKGLKPFTEKDLINENEANREKSKPPPTKLQDRTDLTESEKAVLSRIGEQTESGKPFLDPQQIYNNTIDFLHNLKVARDLKGSDLTPSENYYELARTFAAFNDKVSGFFEEGTRDFHTQEINGEGLVPIIDEAKEIGGGTTDKFEAFAMSKRAVELNERGIETGIDLEHAKKVITEAPKEFEALNKRRIEFKNRILDYAKEAGLFSKEQVAAMKTLNQEHISFKRIQEPDQMTGKIQGSGKGLRRIKGSDLEIKSPLAEDFNDTQMLLRMAELNKIKSLAINDLATENEAGDAFLRKKETNIKAIDVGADEVTKALEKQGIDMTGAHLEDGIKIFRAQQMKAGPGELSRTVDGKLEVYEGNQGVIDSLKHLESSGAGTSLFTTMLRPFASMARAGTVMDLGFAIRHSYKAQMFSALRTKTGMIPFVHPVMAIGEFWKGSDTYKDFVNLGGAQRVADTIDDTYIKTKIEALNKDTPFIQQAWNNLKTPFQMIHAMVAFGDNMTKFAEYKRSPGIEDGTATIDQKRAAAFRAREITPDLSRMGAQMEVMKVVAFMNPEIQGKDLAIRTFKEDPLGSTAKSLALYTVPALMAWYASHDQDWYKALPHWERDTSLNLHAFGYTYKLPQTFDVGLIFGSMPMRILDAMYDKDPTAMRDFMVDMKNRIPGVPMPNAITPILEQMTNYNFFTNTPLIPDHQRKIAPEMQYTPYTSETAKALGKMIDAVPGLNKIGLGENKFSSPMVLDNYMRSWGGPAGQYAIGLVDKALTSSGIRPDPIKPVKSIEELPFFKEFMVRYPAAHDQRTQDFMEKANDVITIKNTFDDLKNNGQIAEAQAYASKHSLEIAQAGAAAGIKAGIEHQSRVIQKLSQEPMDPTQKRQLMDGLINDIVQVSVQGKKVLDDLEKQRNNQAKGQ